MSGDSSIRKPADLAGVPIGVGFHSGSHFSALSALQQILEPDDIRALQRAQRDIDAAPERYKHYFLREMPSRYHDQVDVRGFGTGERIVFETYTKDVFDATGSG